MTASPHSDAVVETSHLGDRCFAIMWKGRQLDVRFRLRIEAEGVLAGLRAGPLKRRQRFEDDDD